MATNKTTATKASVKDFVSASVSESMRDDTRALITMMKEASGWEPFMYGPTIIGFGLYQYTYASGHSGEAPYIAFAPRGREFSLYLEYEFDKREELLSEMGKHRKSKACIYIKGLAGINLAVLKKMIKASLKETKKKHPVESKK